MSDHNPIRPWTCYCLDLGLLHVVSNLENSGYGGFHPAGLVNACLGLKVASGLEFQAFVRTSWDTGTPAEGLFKASTKPVQEKHRLVSFLGSSFIERLIFPVLDVWQVKHEK